MCAARSPRSPATPPTPTALRLEGFVPCPVLPNAHDLAVVDRKHMRLFSFQRHPAASSRNVGGKWHDHNVAKVDELLSLQGVAFIPNIKQRGDELPDAFVADVRLW